MSSFAIKTGEKNSKNFKCKSFKQPLYCGKDVPTPQLVTFYHIVREGNETCGCVLAIKLSCCTNDRKRLVMNTSCITTQLCAYFFSSSTYVRKQNK